MEDLRNDIEGASMRSATACSPARRSFRTDGSIRVHQAQYIRETVEEMPLAEQADVNATPGAPQMRYQHYAHKRELWPVFKESGPDICGRGALSR